jgi:hypothetical protein
MNGRLIELAARDEDVFSALTRLQNGTIEDAIANFSETFRFNDRGLGLEFTDKERLREFFQKERELYPSLCFHTNEILVAEDHVIAEWLLKYSVKEPFYGNLARNVPVALRGVSVARTSNGKITEWSDYYDGLTSRRTALGAHFTEWVEL